MELTRGQNVAFPHAVAAVIVEGASPGAVLVGDDGRAVDPDAWVDAAAPARDGVELLPAPQVGVGVDLSRVPPGVAKVVVVGTTITGPSRVRVAGDGAEVAGFAPGPPGVERALLLVELYRRAGAWKLRAVGQGYAGGLAELATSYGLRAPATPIPAPTGSPSSPSTAQPFVVTDPVQRLGMVLDDASRTTAAYESSAQWARRRLETDLEEVVGDPTLRTGPRGDHARAAAQRRHDDLVGEALTRHTADLALLRAELDELERTLPAPLARWSAPDWAPGVAEPTAPSAQAAPAWAVRLGELALPSPPHRDDLRVPMLRALPLRPAVWVETDPGHGAGSPDIARRMHAALVARVALALPEVPRVTVVDVGAWAGTTAGEIWRTAGLVAVTDPGAASQAVVEHLDHLRLVSLAAETGDVDALPPEHRPGRLLVVCDVPTGLDESAVTALHTLSQAGAAYGVSVLMSGTAAPGLGIGVLDALVDGSLRVPTAPGGDLVDQYAGITWVFHPDPGPDDPRVADAVRARVAARRER